MPQLYINTDKAVDRLFIEISAARGSKITSANPAPMEKSDKRVSWIADLHPTLKYSEVSEKRRVRDRAESEPAPDMTKSICVRTGEAFELPPMSFDPQSSAQAFITGPAEMKVPLPTSEIVTSDKMDIKVDRLAYESIGPGEGAHISHAQAEEHTRAAHMKRRWTQSLPSIPTYARSELPGARTSASTLKFNSKAGAVQKLHRSMTLMPTSSSRKT